MEKNLKKMVKELIAQYIEKRLRRISLKLHWKDDRSRISIIGNRINQTLEYPYTISFTDFAYGVIEAYEEVYGKLRVIPISFREDVYENDRVSVNLYPTGSAGVFDIFVKYREDCEEGE